MYHPNYPPNGPQQATGGYPNHQLTNSMPPHYPPQGNMPHHMNQPPSTMNQQMPYPNVPPNAHMTNASMSAQAPPQMMPPNYQTHPGKMSPSTQQLPPTSIPVSMSDSVKQQQQMYMRPPMMHQSSGKPGSYQQQSIPYSHQMVSTGHHPMQMHQSPYHPYHHHQIVNSSSEQSPHSQYQMPPTSTQSPMSHTDYYAHMRQASANYSSPYNYPPPPNGTPNAVYGKYPMPTDNRPMMSGIIPPPADNLSTSQNANEKLSTADERSETPKTSHKANISRSSTPLAKTSPGAASKSNSFHGDEIENAASSPRTPASPAVSATESSSAKNSKKKGDSFAKLYKLGDEADRKQFLDKLILFNEVKGSNPQCPSVNKELIDLYKFYTSVKKDGGFATVLGTKKKWKEICNYVMGREVSGPLTYTLKKHYIKYLLPYECKYDLNGVDPQKLQDELDPPKEKKKKPNKSAPSPCPIDSNSQSSYPQATTPLSSDGSNLSSLSNSNKSAQQTSNTTTNTTPNGQSNQRSITPTVSKDQSVNTGSSSNEINNANKFTSQQSLTNNNVPMSTQSNLKQQQAYDSKFNSNNSLNNSNNQKTMPNFPPQSPQQSFRPFPSDANLPSSHLNVTSVSDTQPHQPNNLSHNEQQSNVAPYHHMNSPASDHYQQNMSRTHSPLAQRLMQQKSPVPPGYPPSSQAPVYSNNMMTPNKQQTSTDQASNLSSPNFGKRPMPPPTNQQMMYPPQFSPYQQQQQHHYRPPHNVPSGYNNYVDPNSQWSHDPNYGKITNYNQPGVPTSPYPTQSPQINQMQPPHVPPHQQQPGQHPSNLPPQGKPQYLLNLLANNGASGNASPTIQQQQQNLPNQPIPIPPQQLPAPQPQHQQKMQISPQQPSHSSVQAMPPPPPPQQQQYGHIAHTVQPSQQMNQASIGMFPPYSIEVVKPVFVKRKKRTSKDVNHIEAWRLMMSLKSGLLAESTWALDVLSILIHDDNTYLYFSLQKLPGLLDILLEYYKHYLTEIFSDLFDNDVTLEECSRIVKCPKENLIDRQFECETIRRMRKRFHEQEWQDNEPTDAKCDTDSESVKLNDAEESSSTKTTEKRELNVNSELVNDLKEENQFKQFVLSPKSDYTFVTRTGKHVKINLDDNLFVADFDKKWDSIEDKQFKVKNENKLYFSKGYGSITNYIQKHFEVGESSLKFARDLDEKYNDYVQEEANKENLSDNSLEEANNSEMGENNDEDESFDDEISYPRFRETKRKFSNYNDLESEAYRRDQPPLCTLNDYNETISRRCICISTLIRNMSFVPGNELEFSKYKDLLFILGKLLLLHHQHLEKKIKPKTANLKQLEETLFNEFEAAETTEQLNNLQSNYKNTGSCETLDYLQNLEEEWWWDTLHHIRENTLVTLANMSSKLDLSKYTECISLNIFDALLHWIVCKSSDAQDHLPSTSLAHISPKRLSLECLAKLSILEANVDLITSTPPWERMLQLFKCLSDQLSRDQEQTLREFALVLLHNLAISDVAIARSIALTSDAIPQLINFIEFAEQRASEVANQQQNFGLVKSNPEITGTTLEMIKRSAATLRCLARIPENRPLFFNYQQRLIALLMSQALHVKITNLIADILYECSFSESSFEPLAAKDVTFKELDESTRLIS